MFRILDGFDFGFGSGSVFFLAPLNERKDEGKMEIFQLYHFLKFKSNLQRESKEASAQQIASTYTKQKYKWLLPL